MKPPMKTIFYLLAAFAFVGCAAPVENEEDTAEAVGAWTVHPDPAAIKAAIGTVAAPGCEYDFENQCLVIGGVDNYLRLEGGAWTLSTSADAPSRKLLAVTFDRVLVGTMIDDPDGEYDHVIHVPTDVYLPHQGQWVENEAWHTLVEGEYPSVEGAFALLGNP
jgi:hypothetical protein